MWKYHDFETIFTCNDVMNIQYAIGKKFGSTEISYSVGVNACFFPKLTNRPDTTPKYGPLKS